MCTGVYICMQETRVPSLGREDPLEKEMATHSSVLAWETPRTEEPGGLQSTGSQKSRTRLSSETATCADAPVRHREARGSAAGPPSPLTDGASISPPVRQEAQSRREAAAEHRPEPPRRFFLTFF